MLHRCYNASREQYSDWGGRGIKVCERWHIFANYEQDIKQLNGYDDPAKTTIDRKKNHKEGPDDEGFIGYSPDNCEWATRKKQRENQRDHCTQRHFVAYPPGFDGDGAGIISNSQAEFARQHNLNRSHINNCLSGRLNTHKGWRFEYKQQ